MYNDVRLFISGKEVEFSTTPQILYNYKVTDFTNPTTYINGRSKQITVEGTPRNNDLFGHIWRLDRFQYYEEASGPSFDPIKRADFLLFVNGDIYERGYAKLDEITKKGNYIQYKITLFSGIGNLLFNLTYLNDDSNRKMTLADLKYADVGETEPDLDFVINKDTINAAWTSLSNQTRDKWDIINFAVTSEGVPDDFDAAKVLINTNGMSGITRSKNNCTPILNGGSNQYGYVLGEMPFDMTSDNTFDLRSYLLRPVINIERVLEAIKNPENNGGYEVVFGDYGGGSDHFWHSSNPYYTSAWMTLKSLRDLKIDSVEEQTVTGSLSKVDNKNWNITYNSPFGASASGVDLSLNLVFSPSSSTSYSTLYSNTSFKTNDSGGAWTTYVKDMDYSDAAIVQVFAYNGNGDEVARSKAYMCASYGYTVLPNQNKLWDKYTYKSGSQMHFISGKFVKSNNKFYFCDDDGNKIDLQFTISNAKFTTLKIYVERPYSQYTLFTAPAAGANYQMAYYRDGSTPRMFASQSSNVSGRYTQAQALDYNSVSGQYAFELSSFDMSANTYSSMFSGTKITKDKLLALDGVTPCDVLVSYMKLFGLYMFQDPAELPTDENRYPLGVVHIVDRDVFYDDTYKNVHMQIDRGKEIKIKPAVAEKKWYEFDLEPIGSEAQIKYEDTYGYSYSRALVDTGMNFNRDTEDMYDGNVFRSGVMVQEKNKFFNQKVSGIPVYFYGNMKYSLFKPTSDGFDSEEVDYTRKVFTPVPINPEGIAYFDSMPKLQVHVEDLGSNDGSCVLLFYDGMKSLVGADSQAVQYAITDDVGDMANLNDGSPCWLATVSSTDAAGNTIAIFRNSLPNFTRTIIRNGNIIHSWDFGHPQETFIPDVYTTYFDCLYDKCWKEYMSDVYSTNSRRVSCRMRIQGRPNPSWMRKFFYFDNSFWRLNEIKDWNLSTMETTQVEFLKVQNPNNYKLTSIQNVGLIQITLSADSIGYSGGTITGNVISQNASEHWTFSDYINVTSGGTTTTVTTSSMVSPTSGTGRDTPITITVPANSTGLSRTFELKVVSSDNIPSYAYITQAGNLTPYLAFVGTPYTIDAQAGTGTIAFTHANVDTNTIQVTANDSWCTIDSVDTANGIITISVTRNETGSNRSTTLHLSGSGTTATSDTATLTQTSGDLVISLNSMYFDYNQDSTSSKTFTITTDSSWNITTQDQA